MTPLSRLFRTDPLAIFFQLQIKTKATFLLTICKHIFSGKLNFYLSKCPPPPHTTSLFLVYSCNEFCAAAWLNRTQHKPLIHRMMFTLIGPWEQLYANNNMSVACVNTHHFVFDLSNFKRKNEESVGSHLAGISITLRFPGLAHLSTATGTDSKLSVQYCPTLYCILFLIIFYNALLRTPWAMSQSATQNDLNGFKN